MQFWSSYIKKMSPVLYQSCFIIMEDRARVRLQYAVWECQSWLYLYNPHTHRLWCWPLSDVIVAATHRQPPFLAASQSAASRLISFLVVGLRQDIITHRPDNVRFCLLDSVPCRSHLSLAFELSLKVVSIHQGILLFPPFAVTLLSRFYVFHFRRLSSVICHYYVSPP